MNNDCPNRGKGLPTESATICSNSVSGRMGVCRCGICEGLGGGMRGVNWSAADGDDLSTGVSTEDGEEDSRPCEFPEPWVCEVQAALPAWVGSEQSTAF